MMNINLCGLSLLILTFMGLNAFSQQQAPSLAFQQEPVQRLMIAGGYIDRDVREIIPAIHQALALTNLQGNRLHMTEKETQALDALKAIYVKIPKLKTALTSFWDFYSRDYNTFETQDSLTPFELINLIERLNWIENYFKLIKKRRFLIKLLGPSEIEDLEIVELRSKVLKETLSLKIRRIEEASRGNPENMKALFKNVDLETLSSREKSIGELNHALSRLATLESSPKLCIGLF